jgi:hypothetical protein
MLTAKTYTTQHDGEFFDFILFFIVLLFGPFDNLSRRGRNSVQHASYDKQRNMANEQSRKKAHLEEERHIGGKTKMQSIFLTKP